MIRYKIGIEDLKKAIQHDVPGWLARARQRTGHFRSLKKYQEPSSIWSEVKPVYIKVQHGKCAFCERQMETGEFAPIEWDVEHFRPKSRIQLWPNKKETATFNFGFSCGPASSTGYYLLPYHYLNYAASCKVCNTPLKRDYFPIAAKKRTIGGDNPVRLLKEKPFLPYPITDLDEDPESILTFQGYLCVPRARHGERFNRAWVTITFFHLNDRDSLLEQRARLIISAWNALRVHDTDPFDEAASAYLKSIDDPAFPHANCVRSFVRTFRSDRGLAHIFVKKATEYLNSKMKNR